MALVITTEEHRELLKFLYKKYGISPFQYNDVREYISKKIFTKFCADKFLIKDTPSEVIRLVKNDRTARNNVKVNNWKINMYVVRKYVE